MIPVLLFSVLVWAKKIWMSEVWKPYGQQNHPSIGLETFKPPQIFLFERCKELQNAQLG